MPWWREFFLILGGAPGFHSNSTDKEPIFAGLSVSKTNFTDKPPFLSDLSVNFWPLWWGFTDKAGFLDHLSVKSRSKRLNFYGQTDVFGVFVRNRHFSGGPITDKASIFSDVSVNGSDFAKCSAAHHLLNRCTWVRLQAKRWFLRCARNLSPHCFGESNRVEYFFNFGWFCSTFETARPDFGESGRQKSVISLGFCLLSRPRTLNLNQPVDKNHTFPPFFVYFRGRAPWISTSR